MKSILQFSLLESMDVDSLLQYVRNKMEIMLESQKLKQPDKDFSEQEKIIEKLLKTQKLMYSIYEGNKFLIKESVKSATIITDYENKVWRLEQEINKQAAEIENLKQNLVI